METFSLFTLETAKAGLTTEKVSIPIKFELFPAGPPSVTKYLNAKFTATGAAETPATVIVYSVHTSG